MNETVEESVFYPAEYQNGVASFMRAVSLAQTIETRLATFRLSCREAVVLARKHYIPERDAVDRFADLAISTDLVESYGSDVIDAVLAEAMNPSPINGRDETTPSAPIQILSRESYMKRFEPPEYLIDGLMQRGFIYSLTGVTGHAKSAIALLLSELVSSPGVQYLGGHRVEHGRAVYFVGENPTDICMRLIGADSRRADEATIDNSFFIPGVFDIATMMPLLYREIGKCCGDIGLVIIDTSAAYFLGNEELSNTQMGAHARMLRRLTELPGRPCVLVLCHPIKHASEPSQLLPRGGGAFLAEMDGNLTAWKHDEVMVTLHYNKIRGPGFEPMTFRLETIRTDRLIDRQGRQIPTVRAVWASQTEEDEQAAGIHKDDERVLAARIFFGDENPPSIAQLATHCGWIHGDGNPSKTRVVRSLERLEKAKPHALVYRDRGRHFLTEKGKEAARKATLKLAADERAHSGQMNMNLDD